MAEVVVQSNSEGVFEINNLQGNDLDIENIIKEGYAFDHKQISSQKSFRFGLGSDDHFHRADLQHPIVYRLRKKGRSTFAINNRGRITLRSKESCDLDFIENTHKRLETDLPKNGNLIADIFVSFEYQENVNMYDVTFTSKNDNGGVFVSDQVIYRAPDSGYEREIHFSLEEEPSSDFETYLYVKSRDPSIYSRSVSEN